MNHRNQINNANKQNKHKTTYQQNHNNISQTSNK